MFFTFETALEIARLSPMRAERALVIAPDSISAALVKVAANADPHQVAVQIDYAIPDVTAIESTNLFRTQRDQVHGLLRSAVALSSIAWVLSIALMGLVTSMATTSAGGRSACCEHWARHARRCFNLSWPRVRYSPWPGVLRDRPGCFCHFPVQRPDYALDGNAFPVSNAALAACLGAGWSRPGPGQRDSGHFVPDLADQSSRTGYSHEGVVA